MKVFRVERQNGDYENVYADYSTLRDGHLSMRKFRISANGYPELVKVFAPGSWLTMDETDLNAQDGRDDNDIPF